MAPLQEASNSPRHSLTSPASARDATPPKARKPQLNPQRHTPKVAALARLRDASLQQQQQATALALGASAGGGGSPMRVPSGGGPLAANLSGASLAGGAGLVVETQRYEEWMKIATDNKITSNNTWTLALIDYFHDMRLLRNSDGEGSINFQKASCTLDGCVKIWTSRVDSVATETGKLLSGLAEDARPMGDADDSDDDPDDGANEATKTKRKTSRAPATLADSFDKLRVKALELEFTVDPLFKKTSADFDEGGAGGILMNHLGCDGRMRVVFDAGDARLDDEQDGDEEEEVNGKVELGRLFHKYIQDAAMDDKALCPSLATFKFAENATLDLPFFSNNAFDDPPVPSSHAPFNNDSNDVPPHDDPFRDMGGGGDDDFGAPFPDAGFGGGDAAAGDGHDDFFADLGEDTSHLGGGAAGSSLEIDIDVSLADGLGLDGVLGGRGKAWAGPEHWKMRRVLAKKDEPAAPKARKEKVAFSIDFEAPPLQTHKELFAPGTAATIGGTSSTARKKASLGGGRASAASSSTAGLAAGGQEEWVLPDDYGFSEKMLLRLFLKPRTAIRIRRRRAGGGAAVGSYYPGGGGMADDADMGGMDMGDFGSGGAFDDDPAPFATQFLLADEDDDLHYPDPEDDDDDDEDEIQAAMGVKPTRVRPERIGHATRAKRVDVKKLKESIWKELEEVVVPVKEMPLEPRYVPSPPSPSHPSSPPASEAFVPVLAGLRTAYPPDKMAEISTSFCFICLLHLANEKGLRIQAPAIDERGENKAVGGLDKLRVLRCGS